MKKILDLHIHSKYARACSPRLELPSIAKACEEKGIDIVSTGDFTYPAWFSHLEESLIEDEPGLYKLKDIDSPTRFLLGTEVACIYKDKDKLRRVHLLLYAPTLVVAAKINAALDRAGVNRESDGRPIFGMTAKALLKLMLEIDPLCMMIPAHAWTPWFAIFGSKSGYDSIEECFEELATEIFAIETGLSSDPPMNRRLTSLDNIVLISNSDAHSLENLGREANVFQFTNKQDVSYHEIRRILKENDRKKFLYTIEFYPEEGMYHFDGHRECKVSMAPSETKKLKEVCPECKRKVTVGVLHRVDDLADREEKAIPDTFVHHKYIVPLREVIASSERVGKKSKKVQAEYEHLIQNLGNEFSILLDTPIKDIARVTRTENLAGAIQNMRNGNVKVVPGYDGVYGTVEVLLDGADFTPAQSRLFE